MGQYAVIREAVSTNILEFEMNIWDSAERSSAYCHYSMFFGRHQPLNIQYPSLVMNTGKYSTLLLVMWRQKTWNNVALSWGKRGILDLIIPEGDKKILRGHPEGFARGMAPKDFFWNPKGDWRQNPEFDSWQWHSSPIQGQQCCRGDDNIHNHP